MMEQPNWDVGYHEVEQSDMLGAPIALGHILTGYFQYETNPERSPYPEQYPEADTRSFVLGSQSWISYVDTTSGLSFQPRSDVETYADLHIGNGKLAPSIFTSDSFYFGRSEVGDTMQWNSFVTMSDSSGKAFPSSAIPTQLSLAAFDQASVSGFFIERRVNPRFMNFSADITSLERVDADVPEPSSALLFAIAAGGLFGLRKRRRPSRS